MNSGSITQPRAWWHGEPVSEDDTEYLVHGLIPRRGIGFLVGAPGCGKTFLAIDLAISIATGKPFLDKLPKVRGGTLILAGEGASSIPERIDAARLGLSNPARRGSGPLPVVCCSVYALREAHVLSGIHRYVQGLATEMQARRGVPLSLIVIDTLPAAFGFTDENSAAEATRAMAGLERLSMATSSFVLATTHPKKGSGILRGSGVFEGSADVIFSVHAEKAGSGAVRRRSVTLTKSRRARTGWRSGFRLETTSPELMELGSCYVVALGSQEAPPQTHSAGRKIAAVAGARDSCSAYLEAVEAALAIYGVTLTGPASVFAVDEEHVRAQFVSRWPSKSDSAERVKDARRKAYSRGEAAAIAARLVCSREVDGTLFVWRKANLPTMPAGSQSGV